MYEIYSYPHQGFNSNPTRVKLQGGKQNMAAAGAISWCVATVFIIIGDVLSTPDEEK